MLINFTMPRHRLGYSSPRILILIMLPSMSDEHAPKLLDLFNQIATFHATSNSATRRNAGISPLEKSE